MSLGRESDAYLISKIREGYHIKFGGSFYMVLKDEGGHLIFKSNPFGSIRAILPVGECKTCSIEEVIENFSSLILRGGYVDKQE
jgi:hypothetical protein